MTWQPDAYDPIAHRMRINGWSYLDGPAFASGKPPRQLPKVVYYPLKAVIEVFCGIAGV